MQTALVGKLRAQRISQIPPRTSAILSTLKPPSTRRFSKTDHFPQAERRRVEKLIPYMHVVTKVSLNRIHEGSVVLRSIEISEKYSDRRVEKKDPFILIGKSKKIQTK